MELLNRLYTEYQHCEMTRRYPITDGDKKDAEWKPTARRSALKRNRRNTLQAERKQQVRFM
jgi:hypothetical protein